MTRYELDEYTAAVRQVDRLRARLRDQTARHREREAASRQAIDDLQATHDAAIQALIEERVEVARLRRLVGGDV